MNSTSPILAAAIGIFFSASKIAMAAPVSESSVTLPAAWHPTSLGQSVGYMLLFALLGIVTAILGYKLFDKATPGDLSREIIENKNIAAAIVAASVILGVCLIVAAAMMG